VVGRRLHVFVDFFFGAVVALLLDGWVVVGRRLRVFVDFFFGAAWLRCCWTMMIARRPRLLQIRSQSSQATRSSRRRGTSCLGWKGY